MLVFLQHFWSVIPLGSFGNLQTTMPLVSILFANAFNLKFFTEARLDQPSLRLFFNNFFTEWFLFLVRLLFLLQAQASDLCNKAVVPKFDEQIMVPAFWVFPFHGSRGKRITICICPDVWSPEDADHQRRRNDRSSRRFCIKLVGISDNADAILLLLAEWQQRWGLFSIRHQHQWLPLWDILSMAHLRHHGHV